MQTKLVAAITFLILTSCGRTDDSPEPEYGQLEQGICADPDGCPTGGNSGPVGTPSALRVVTSSASLISIGFTCGGNADRHTLLAREDGSSTTVRVSSPTVACPSVLNDARVEPGKRYCWSVEARNADSTKVSSALCATVPLDNNPVAAPGFAITGVTTDTVFFEVTDQSNNEGGFRIWGKKLSSTTWSVLSALPRTTRRHAGTGEILRVQDHRFAPDEQWEFVAESYKEFAPASAWSATLRANLLPLPPTAPGNFRIVMVEEHAVTLRWDDSLNEDYYYLEARISAAPNETRVAGIDSTEYRFTGLPSGYHMCFDLYAKNTNTSAMAANRPCTDTLTTPLTDLNAEVTLHADPPPTGLLPFVASFPAFGSATGNVNRIEFVAALNPPSLLALDFVKAEGPTSACADANLRVRLTPGQSLNAAELTKLFGTATPLLPIALKACAVINTQTVPEPVVRVYWHGT